MRAAPPPVELSLGTGRRERAVVAVLHACAVCAMVAWLAQWAGAGTLTKAGPVVMTGVLIVAALGGLALGWLVLSPLRGRLRWDGAAWALVPAGANATVHLRAVHLQMDLGRWLLLRVAHTDRRPAGWCGVTTQEAGAAWHGLRLALYHRPPLDPARQDRL